MMTVFLSYGRGDDEPFVERLCQALNARGFDVWYDRESMSSRGRTFHQEIRDAIAARERLVLVVGPHAVTSDYVRQEWQFALEADKVVTPILRVGDYPLVPDELKLLHCEDFRDATVTRSVNEEANFEFQSPLARILLKFCAYADRDVKNVHLSSDLDIVPILTKYDSHSEMVVPLESPNKEAITKWIDDRIVSFVHTYLSIQG